jgi:hydrogenase expression/formation protein HypE
VHIHLDESLIPVQESVQGACEMLGLDPLYVANEGRFVMFVPAAEAPLALKILHDHPLGREARQIGRVSEDAPAQVTMKTRIGANRIIDMLSGEQLPRIC